MRSFVMRAGENDEVYGVVVRTHSPSKPAGSRDNVWVRAWKGSDASQNLTIEADFGVDETQPWDATTLDRKLFIGIRGRQITILRFDVDGAGVLSHTLAGGPNGTVSVGVGPRPTLDYKGKTFWGHVRFDSTTQKDPPFARLSVIGPDAVNVYELTSDGQSAIPADPSFSGPWVTEGYQNTEDIDGLVDAMSGSPKKGSVPVGTYTFAFAMLDSRTGRKSPLSNKITVTSNDVAWNNDDGSPINSVFYFVISYDPDDWDSVMLFRSIEPGSALLQDATFTSSTLFLDGIYDLKNAVVASNSGATFGKASGQEISAIYYEKSDASLALSAVLDETRQFLLEPPRGGECVGYDGTLLVSRIKGDPNVATTLDPKDVDTTKFGLDSGALMWSSFEDRNSEAFPVANIYVPESISDEIVELVRLGDIVIGLAKTRIYFIKREGFLLDVTPAHEGFGITSAGASAATGTLVYYMSENGLKVVDASGALRDVANMNEVIRRRWQGSLDKIRMAYDPVANAVFIVNTQTQDGAALWLNTGRIVEYEDMGFTTIVRGTTHRLIGDDTSPLVDRALALRNSGSGSTGTYTVYVWDVDRSKAQSQWLDEGLDVLRTTVSAVNGSNITIADSISTDAVVGLKVYVLDSATPSRIGGSTTVTARVNGTTLTVADPSAVGGGDRIGFNPVVCRVVSPALPVQVNERVTLEDNDHMRIKKVESIQAAFTDVGGAAAGSVDAKFQGLFYEGDKTSASVVGTPMAQGNTSVGSVVDGSGTWDAPLTATGIDPNISAKSSPRSNSAAMGVQTFCPELDYKLLAVRAKGRIEETQRTARPGT